MKNNFSWRWNYAYVYLYFISIVLKASFVNIIYLVPCRMYGILMRKRKRKNVIKFRHCTLMIYSTTNSTASLWNSFWSWTQVCNQMHLLSLVFVSIYFLIYYRSLRCYSIISFLTASVFTRWLACIWWTCCEDRESRFWKKSPSTDRIFNCGELRILIL